MLPGAQEIPSDLEPILFMDAVHADLRAACPSGFDKCECMHAPGTFTDGPFNPNEDPIGAMINFVGCAPGNADKIYFGRQSSCLAFILTQDTAFARMTLRRSSMSGLSFSAQFKICVREANSTGNLQYTMCEKLREYRLQAECARFM